MTEIGGWLQACHEMFRALHTSAFSRQKIKFKMHCDGALSLFALSTPTPVMELWHYMRVPKTGSTFTWPIVQSCGRVVPHHHDQGCSALPDCWCVASQRRCRDRNCPMSRRCNGAALPDGAQVFSVLRHPADRLVSQWHHLRRLDPVWADTNAQTLPHLIRWLNDTFSPCRAAGPTTAALNGQGQREPPGASQSSLDCEVWRINERYRRHHRVILFPAAFFLPRDTGADAGGARVPMPSSDLGRASSGGRAPAGTRAGPRLSILCYEAAEGLEQRVRRFLRDDVGCGAAIENASVGSRNDRFQLAGGSGADSSATRLVEAHPVEDAAHHQLTFEQAAAVFPQDAALWRRHCTAS